VRWALWPIFFMAFDIYVLKRTTTGKHYSDSTQNLSARLKAHNDGLSLFTKGCGSWVMVYSEAYPKRSAALARQKFLKSGSGREFLKGVIG
jgi:putative endonuclease